MSTAPDRAGDRKVARASRTGTAEPSAPPARNTTAPTRTAPAARPMASHRRGPEGEATAGAAAAASAGRLIRSADRSAFLGSMPLNLRPPAEVPRIVVNLHIGVSHGGARGAATPSAARLWLEESRKVRRLGGGLRAQGAPTAAGGALHPRVAYASSSGVPNKWFVQVLSVFTPTAR